LKGLHSLDLKLGNLVRGLTGNVSKVATIEAQVVGPSMKLLSLNQGLELGHIDMHRGRSKGGWVSCSSCLRSCGRQGKAIVLGLGVGGDLLFLAMLE
jgi:hypothetical protein